MKPRTRKENYLAKIAKDPDAVEMTPKTRTEHYLNEIAENGGGGSEPFIVTLTPTAADMSGTMDKTVGEMYEAYLDGRKILFRITVGGSQMEVECYERWFRAGDSFPSFNAYIIENGNNTLIFAHTGATSDADKSNYSTNIYTLTPAT